MDLNNDSQKVELILRHDDGDNEVEISLREIIEPLLKGKWLILGITIIFVVVCGLYVFFTNSKGVLAQTVIELNFPGIENGLNPDETKFEMHAIKAPAIIQKAIEQAGIADQNISVEEIRKDISIEPVVPGEISEKALAAVKDGKEFVYYPNQFIISYNSSNNKFDKNEKARILNAVISQYEADFRDQYTDKTILGNALGSLDYVTYDYPEISTVIHNQISIMRNYLKTKAAENSDFRSTKTGLSFNDIIDSIDIIDKIDVNRLDSIVGSYNLTKDKEKLITKYEYNIKMNGLNQAKKNDESITALNMMEKFNLDQKSILIPGLTGSAADSLDGSLTIADNSYYDSLAERAANAGVEATNYLHDNEFLKSEIERLKNDTVPEAMKKSAIEDVLALVDSIKVNIVNLVQQTNDTAIEYFDTKYTQAIKRLSPVEVIGLNKMVYLAIAALAGLIMGLMIVLFREYWKSSKIASLENKHD